MKYKVSLNGKTYEVIVEQGEAQLISVTDNTFAAPAPAVPPETPAAAPASAAPAAPAVAPAPAALASGDVIKAPMPGTVLRFTCEVGATVKKGQVLAVLEAMKMENDITAARDGVVLQLVADKGAMVESGAPLLVLG